MKDRKTVLVTASHVHPDYCFVATLTTVDQTNEGYWFAMHPKLGCGCCIRAV